MIKVQRPGRVRDQKPWAQHQTRGKFSGQFHSLELKPLKNMDSIEVVRILNENMARLKYFLRSEEEDHNTDEFTMDLTCTLANACSAPPSEYKNKILACLKGSVFLSSKIPRLLDRIQGSTTLHGQESRKKLFQWLIVVFVKYLRHLPSSYADLPYDQLKRALEHSNIDGKDELQNDLQDFKHARDDIIRGERQKHGKRYINKAGQKPPNDFRDIPVCPTSKEIRTQERPFLRKNITKGRYDDAEHYLDVQFRLLREDFLEPLREGIPEIVQNVPRRQRKQLMRNYPGARIVDKTLRPSGITYKVQFDTSKFDTRKWAHSKRLIYGSFLCLSKDNFETMLFATVCDREPFELVKGRIDIRFIEGQDVFGIEKLKCDYQMVESPAYFEAYRHVLTGLKELDETSMPFKKYLVECSEDVNPPEYLRREDTQHPVCYDLRLALDVPELANASAVPILQSEAWPSVEILPLNNSQLEALKTALTTEFSVIQGPPGTGKTYVGAKIVRCLLDNRETWDPKEISPMLMVCYTNHALDQFLEKVLEFLPKKEIIRVGGRCKSQQLEECNLKLFTRKYKMYARRVELREMIDRKCTETTQWRKLLAKADTVLLEFEDLEELLNAEYIEQLYNAVFPHNAASECRTPSNTFKLWLCSNKQMNSYNQLARSKGSEVNICEEILVLPDNDGGKDDSAPYDNTSLTMALDFEQSNSKNQHTVGSGNSTLSSVSIAGNTSPKKPNETDESNASDIYPKIEKDFSLALREFMETPLEDTIPERISGQHRGKLAESGAFQAISDTNNAPVSKSLKESNEEEDVPQVEKPQTLTDNKTESTEEIMDVFEEKIAIEKEADLIQDQRRIHGEEEFLPVMVRKAEELNSQSYNEEEGILDQEEGWEVVNYRKKGKNLFAWKPAGDERSKERMENASNADNANQTKPSKKKKKKKKNKNKKTTVTITADLGSIKTDLEKVTTMSSDEAMTIENIWLLSPSDRLRLYLSWVESYRERYQAEINRNEQEYQQLCQQFEGVRFEEEEEVMRRATVVGMTTSGAARYHSVLQRIAPKIVVIEEAAEVMEAHIITSLSANTKHTILIGDHKQLRPKATVYELAQKYNLEISLFERMVMNSMDCKRLSIQHRMRPEIAELTKRIYDHEIVDHETVCEFEDIVGVASNLFFIDHCKPEKLEGGLQSYSNSHEADFLVALCKYLLIHGYQPSQITILTMYTGQLLLLQEKMPKRNFGGIRVCAVDNFQGEENDIILLSLVRSNSERKIGFLGESNRICVALSRARKGFYCIGNFNLLKGQCKLWKEICDHLQKKNAIDESLPIVCKKHKNKNNVRSSSDFDIIDGGCKMPCGDRLKCGHSCDRPCHASDLDHKDSRCTKVCLTSCPNEHKCKYKCHYPRECPTCHIMVLKTIPQCGHQQSVPCSTDPAKFSCREKCEKILPCGHVKTLLCFQDPLVYNRCEWICSKVLDCGHSCSMRCTDPCQCNTEIEVVLGCGHRKKLPCHMKDNPPNCTERCNRVLTCGHTCSGVCYEDCRIRKCATMVYKTLPCGHEKIVFCSRDPISVFCSAPCERRLDCGHKCSSVCGRPCIEVQCQVLCLKECNDGHACPKPCHYGISCGDCMKMVDVKIPKCKHSTWKPCHVDTATLTCPRPCERFKTCGHPCLDICGADCENQPCKKRVDVELPCGHQISMLCYVTKSGIENLQCNEIVEKELCCKHRKDLPCHKNPDEYKCKEKVKVKLSCGHTKSLVCSVATGNLQDISCMVKTKRKLPCGHEATLPCYRTPEEYLCEKEVEISLSCSHRKLVTCAKARHEPGNESCDTTVTRKLACGHEKEMKCSDKQQEAFCEVSCERSLPCKHPCPGKCGEDCSGFKCAVIVPKFLACGFHKMNSLCSEDVSEVICANSCTKYLFCGHKCPGKCLEDCNLHKCQKKVLKGIHCAGNHSLKMACSTDPLTATCRKQCVKTLDCGHPCPGLCSEDCGNMQCMRRVEKRFPCNHEQAIKCHESKTATCSAHCGRRKSSCKHICQGVCGQDCSKYPCGVVVVKTLSCGHKVKMPCSQNADEVECPAPCKEYLPCGHQCSGTCSGCHQRDSHEMCQYPCRRLLVCSHRCKARCGEPCPPCDRKCSRRCPHAMCTNHCSKPCNSCKQPCTWSCTHYQCNSLCGEDCDRPRCNAPCPKKLSCRHPCIGLCGENCPTICPVCHPKKFSSLLAGGRGKKMESARFLQLWDCNHIVEVNEMDRWMDTHPDDDVQLIRRCPKCTVAITFSYRYGRIIKKMLTDVEDVKKQVQEVEREVKNSISLIEKDLLRLNYTVRLARSIPWNWNPLTLRGTPERRVSLIFTFKNHLMILRQVQQAYPVLENIRRLQAGSQNQVDEGGLLKDIEDAFGQIKEYLEKPQLDLKTLSQVHQQTKKIFLFCHVLEAQSKALQRRIPFSDMGKTRLRSARERFALFLQGEDNSLDIEWLEKIVNALRTEVKLPVLQVEEAPSFANFPGYQRDVWNLCGQGHIYYTTRIVRGGEEITVGGEGCTQCAYADHEAS